MEELRKEFEKKTGIVLESIDFYEVNTCYRAKKYIEFLEQQLSEKQNWNSDELGKEISELRDVIWDKVGKEHQSGMVASPEYVVLLAKDLLKKQTEPVSEKEFKEWAKSIREIYKAFENDPDVSMLSFFFDRIISTFTLYKKGK
jgi:hypothetical protein